MNNRLENITEDILIYGAHLVALECARWLIRNGKRDRIIGFAVTGMKGNPEELEGFPVKCFEEYKNLPSNLTVVIAMPMKYHDEVQNYVRSKGISHILKISLEDMSKLKGERFLAIQNEYQKLQFILEEDENDPSWMNMLKKKSSFRGDDGKNAEKCHYKFPTLFYLDEEKFFAESQKLDFEKDYKKACGEYRNLHMLSASNSQENGEKNLKEIMCVYMAYSNWDSTRVGAGQQYAPWICPLQVGSSLAKQKYVSLSDDTGDNISAQNFLFAEMTGAYWIWKNVAGVRYKGLCHYRRHFIISEKEIMDLGTNGIDVILTTPRYVPGGVGNMFFEETPFKKNIYEEMLYAISKSAPEDRSEFEEYMECCFYYPNNMVVAKQEIYDSYCSWVFPILFYMAEQERKSVCGYERDRHLAYGAELLTSYYFIKNRDRYVIAVTDYQFYS